MVANFSGLQAASAADTPDVQSVQGGVYWQGADGNIYVKNSAGVKSIGKPSAATGSLLQLQGAKQIADPNPPKVATAPANPTGASSAGSGTTYADKSNDIALNTAGLGSVDTQTQAGIDKINAALSAIISGYDTEATANKTNYTNSSNDNQNQLQTSKQTALVNAASGRQGLLGTLASIGALSGDGITQANAAVQKGANADLATGGNTFATNQSGLDTAFNAFTAADKARRDQAQTAANNDILSTQNAGATSKQNFLTNLSNDYAAEGNSAQAKNFSSQAAALYPTIASTNVPSVSLTPTTAAYTPASLASYLSNSNTAVTTTPQGAAGTTTAGIPGLTATSKKNQVVAA